MLEVDKFSRVPIYEQVVAEFERMIADGEMNEGEIMPSVRQLSQELSVNPNTLQKAYAELEHKNLCYSVPGSGRYIAKGAKAIILGEKRKGIDKIIQLCRELKKCGVPREEVLEAVKEAFEGGN